MFNQLRTHFEGIKLRNINERVMKLQSFWTHLPLSLIKKIRNIKI